MTRASTSTEPRINLGREVDRIARLIEKVPPPGPRESHDKRAVVVAREIRQLGYIVDDEAGLHCVRFVERYCHHTTPGWYGKAFLLAPWQFVVSFALFGVVDGEGHRQFWKLWLEVAKKNGKTAWVAALLLYCLFGLHYYGAGIYSAASSRDQAGIVYRAMASMVRQEPALRRQAKVYDSKKYIYLPRTESFYQALSSDGDFNDGLIVQVAAVDEVHRHKSRALYDVLVNGMGTMTDPLFLQMTTAGAGHSGLAWDEHQFADQVLDGKVSSPRLLPVIYSVPETADWRKRKVWRMANPSMGLFLREDDIAEAVAKAQASPSEEHSVRRLRLNQWVAAETKWLDLLAWERAGKSTLASMENRHKARPFYGGFDISHSADFTAWAMVFPWDDDADELGADVLVRFWLPEEAVKKLRPQMRPTIEAWARDGFITLTDGDVVDLRQMRDQILKDCETYDCKQIGFDKFHAHGVVSDLMEAGLDLVDVGQMFRSMNTPCKELERLLARGRLEHGGNPVLRWMAGNAVAEKNQDDLIRPSRKRSTDKIDGLVATLMALERAMFEEETSNELHYVSLA